MYYLLTERFKDQEQSLVNVIIKKLNVDYIYFLGSALNQTRTESIFMPDAPTKSWVGHYYLLVVIGRMEKAGSYYQDIIENSCQHIAPVTAITISEKHFDTLYRDANMFSKLIAERAVKLYQSETANSFAYRSIGAQQIITTSNTQIEMIRDFIAGAEFFIERSQLKLAMLMLHQAFEQTLQCILWQTTGMKFKTHSISKLTRYVGMVHYKIEGILSPNQGIIGKLQKSYYDARYNDAYKICQEEVLKVLGKAKSLQDILHDVTNAR